LNLPPVTSPDDANKTSNLADDSLSALLCRKKSINSKPTSDALKEALQVEIVKSKKIMGPELKYFVIVATS
jgi:hypothetical protein